jgi:hypothetical protein
MQDTGSAAAAQGIFAAWQPRYASNDIPTFPVEFSGGRKKPAVRCYLQLGLPYSHELALKFPANDAFGFGLRRARVAVLDVDTTDERVRDDAFARHGEPVIAVRTLQGRWQGWYRHNGERRRVRPWPGRPIDVLGHGYVCAPPSRGPAGQYEFIQGGLDDLDRLTVLRGLDLPPSAEPTGRIPEGVRDDTLWRHCMRAAWHCDDFEALLDVAQTFADDCIDLKGMTHAYTAAEVRKCAESAWQLTVEGRNLFGRGAAVVLRHDEFDGLGQDAAYLLVKLRRHHWGREFALTLETAAALGWGKPRFLAARDALLKAGKLLLVHRGGRRPGDCSLYRLP